MQQSSSLKRLMKDWKEVIDNPLESIYAQPYPIMKDGQIEGYDMYNWFATLLAPSDSHMEGTVISIRMSFGRDYPRNPPNVNCLTKIEHPHVFGNYICLNMLSPPSDYCTWSTWSSTYSVLSILLQLESFLLDPFMVAKSEKYSKDEYLELKEMGHDPKNGKFWPWAPHWKFDYKKQGEEIEKPKEKEEEKEVVVIRKKLKPIVGLTFNQQVSSNVNSQWRDASETIQTFSTLRTKDIQFKSVIPKVETVVSPVVRQAQPIQLSEISNSFGEIVLTTDQVHSELKSRARLLEPNSESYQLFERVERIPIMKIPSEILREIFSYLDVTDLKTRVEKASHYFKSIASSKALIQERELICFYSKVSFKEDTLGIGLNFITKPNGYIENISSPMDLISRNSFYNENATKSVWGISTKFWIPIFINKKHADFEMFRSSVKAIYNAYPSITNVKGMNYSDVFDSPDVYIDLICKIMNSMIVDLMKGEIHASTKYLQGYLYFHRWLLYILEIFPYKIREIERKVKNFIYNENLRTKRYCPNLGEFLILLSVLGPSKLTWDSVKYAIVEETCTRNVLWALKTYPELIKLDNDMHRIPKTWKANKVSCKLLMFHIFFLKTVIEKEHAGRSLDEISRLYDSNFGLSPETHNGQDLEDLVQIAIFKNNNARDFTEFLEYVDLDQQLNDNEKINEFLRYCVVNSEKRRYHKVDQVLVTSKVKK